MYFSLPQLFYNFFLLSMLRCEVEKLGDFGGNIVSTNVTEESGVIMG